MDKGSLEQKVSTLAPTRVLSGQAGVADYVLEYGFDSHQADQSAGLTFR